MIFNRPPNLILGAFTAIFNVVVLVLASQGIVIEPGVTAAVNLAAGAIITVIAYQPPTLVEGDTYTIQTPKGEPNYQATVAPPPEPTTPIAESGGSTE